MVADLEELEEEEAEKNSVKKSKSPSPFWLSEKSDTSPDDTHTLPPS